MEKVARRFNSFEEMNEADIQESISFTPEERVRNFVILMNRVKRNYERTMEEASPRVSRRVVRKNINDT